MSLIPNDFKKQIKEKLDKIEIFKKTLSDEEIKAIMQKFVKFEIENINNDKIFNDGSCDWIPIQSPQPDENNKPKETPNDFNDDNYRWTCKFKSKAISIFGTSEQIKSIGWNNEVILRGTLRRQYKIPGESDYYKSIDKLSEAIGKKAEELKPNDDYFVFYTFNIFQVIA